MANIKNNKTLLGIEIPSGWNVVNLHSLFVEKKIKSSDLEKFPLFSFTIEKGVCPKTDRYDRQHLLKDLQNNQYHIIEKDDFIYNPMNLRFGAIGVSKIEFPVSVSAYYNILEPKDKSLIGFLENYLKSHRLLNIYDRIAIGSLEEKRRVHLSMFWKIDIPLPPSQEIAKIGNILSTWDKAIEQTQYLIEQLKNRKKGLMQQLLNGKTRLKGFSGEWKTVKGAELFSNHSDKNHDGALEVLSATQDKGVIPRSETGIDIKYDKESLINYKKVEVGDYVISLRSFQGGIEYSNYEGLVSPAYTVLKEKMPISKAFYKEYMKTKDFINRLNSIIYGIRDGKQISYKEFGTLKLLYPPVEEQQAVAKVLTTADKEIKTQETYLQQLQDQKKGLMQQLLTGQKRVKLNN